MTNDELALLITASFIGMAWQIEKAKQHLESVIMAGQNELDVAIAGLETSETAEIAALQGLQTQFKASQDNLAAAIAAGKTGPDLQAEVDKLNADAAKLAAAALAINPAPAPVGGGGVGVGTVGGGVGGV